MTLQARLEVYEKDIIEAYCKHFNWKVNKVHKALGIDRKTLYRKMVKHGIRKREEGKIEKAGRPSPTTL